MVHDARVNHCMARLGGVYRDPARVTRDASTLLLSSVGNHLQPIAAVHVDVTNNGGSSNNNNNSNSNSNSNSSSTVLVLQGTIAIHFRGNTYQLLMDIYLVPGYPIRPPVCYVRLADSSMYLKQNHKHVGSDGKVYLPYLHEWNASTHNLVELVVAMSSVFSAEPPVFSRPTLPPPPPPPPPLPQVPAAVAVPTTIRPPSSPIRNGMTNNMFPSSSLNTNTAIHSSTLMNGTTGTTVIPQATVVMGANHYMNTNNSVYNNNNKNNNYSNNNNYNNNYNNNNKKSLIYNNNYNNSNNNNNNMMAMSEQQQLEVMLARDAEESNAAIEAARRADMEEREREEIQKQLENARLIEVRTNVQMKIRQYIQEFSLKIQKDVNQDWKDSELLNTSQMKKINYQQELYSTVRTKLVQQVSTVSDCITNIEHWIEQEQEFDKDEKTYNDKTATTTSVIPSKRTTIEITPETINTIVVPVTKIDQQMIDLASENAALQDVLYYLDRALYNSDACTNSTNNNTSSSSSSSNMDCTTHLKHVRKIAKQQFFARALLLKIQQHQHQHQHQHQKQNQNQNTQQQQRQSQSSF